MEDSDILTLGWGCEPPSNLWSSSGEEFVTLDVEDAGKDSQEFATLEVAKERDRQFYNACVDTDVKIHQNMRLQDWDLMRLEETIPLAPVHVPTTRLLPAPTPIHPVTAPAPALHHSVTDSVFYVDSFHAPSPVPVQYPTSVVPPPILPQYPAHPGHAPHHVTGQYPVPVSAPTPVHQDQYGGGQVHQVTYQQQTISHPTFTAYTPFVADLADPKRHTVRSPVSGKFVRGGPLQPKQNTAPKTERKRPGPKTKVKQESEPKPPDEPEYDPEVIANAHLTMDDDYYVCSVCKMKFKQPGNARRHIITVHRNEKNHECLKCSARFGRKDKLKTHMMRNHGFSADDIKATFKHSGQGRQRSSILVNRDNRKSTESSCSSDTDDSNPLNLKTSGKRSGGSKHLSSNKRRKV